ncbi:hypothetical protein B484DRAFT_425721 [Ochromonadaceae sp. CCMP2298]|nr:hypothetical protein B484DRAFT_425721 [Ochromonadaceae sp. CCMP2298]
MYYVIWRMLYLSVMAMGGMALANSKLGVVHGFAAVLGGRYEGAPHGALCAALLPLVFEKNAQVLEGILSSSPTTALLADAKTMDALVKLGRFQEVTHPTYLTH